MSKGEVLVIFVVEGTEGKIREGGEDVGRKGE